MKRLTLLQRFTVAALLLLASGVAFDFAGSYANCAAPESPWGARKKQLEEQYRVDICFDVIGYPIRLLGGTFSTVPTHQRLKVLDALAIDLQAYDPAFLDSALERIYIFDSLLLQGQWYGGTYDPWHKWVYIQTDWLGDDGTSRAGAGFHSELSSILLWHHPDLFPLKAWSELNPSDFTYQRAVSSWENLREGNTDYLGDEQLYAQGFLNGYGQNTLEDDMNGFAQYLAAKPDLLQELAAEYPAVRRKAELLQGFYQALGFRSG
ncbi:MAG TPA: hypothetical protein VJG32_06880 [Anaerolineae bacterium]|nr:hypothetical protein [Anaerolineae bacterium]